MGKFTPFYFDIQEPIEKSRVLYMANVEFVRCIDSKTVLNLKFLRFLHFTDGILI